MTAGVGVGLNSSEADPPTPDMVTTGTGGFVAKVKLLPKATLLTPPVTFHPAKGMTSAWAALRPLVPSKTAVLAAKRKNQHLVWNDNIARPLNRHDSTAIVGCNPMPKTLTWDTIKIRLADSSGHCRCAPEGHEAEHGRENIAAQDIVLTKKDLDEIDRDFRPPKSKTSLAMP